MSNLMYFTIVIALIMLWSAGYFVYDLGSITHLLLVIVLVVILFKMLK